MRSVLLLLRVRMRVRVKGRVGVDRRRGSVGIERQLHSRYGRARSTRTSRHGCCGTFVQPRPAVCRTGMGGTMMRSTRIGSIDRLVVRVDGRRRGLRVVEKPEFLPASYISPALTQGRGAMSVGVPLDPSVRPVHHAPLGSLPDRFRLRRVDSRPGLARPPWLIVRGSRGSDRQELREGSGPSVQTLFWYGQSGRGRGPRSCRAKGKVKRRVKLDCRWELPTVSPRHTGNRLAAELGW